jgi:hypothetical protein
MTKPDSLLKDSTNFPFSEADREPVTQLLKDHIIEVAFIKGDGTRRVMNCTLQSKYLPIRESEISTRPPRPGTMTVWDVDKHDWRSFNLETVLTISFPFNSEARRQG